MLYDCVAFALTSETGKEMRRREVALDVSCWHTPHSIRKRSHSEASEPRGNQMTSNIAW